MQAIAVRVSILVALLTLVACVVRSIVRAGSWQGTLSTTAVLWEPVMCVKCDFFFVFCILYFVVCDCLLVLFFCSLVYYHDPCPGCRILFGTNFEIIKIKNKNISSFLFFFFLFFAFSLSLTTTQVLESSHATSSCPRTHLNIHSVVFSPHLLLRTSPCSRKNVGEANQSRHWTSQ